MSCCSVRLARAALTTSSRSGSTSCSAPSSHCWASAFGRRRDPRSASSSSYRPSAMGTSSTPKRALTCSGHHRLGCAFEGRRDEHAALPQQRYHAEQGGRTFQFVVVAGVEQRDPMSLRAPRIHQAPVVPANDRLMKHGDRPAGLEDRRHDARLSPKMSVLTASTGASGPACSSSWDISSAVPAWPMTNSTLPRFFSASANRALHCGDFRFRECPTAIGRLARNHDADPHLARGCRRCARHCAVSHHVTGRQRHPAQRTGSEKLPARALHTHVLSLQKWPCQKMTARQ